MSLLVPVRRPSGLLARLRSVIPTGSTLPDHEFARRHRVLLTLLWIHVPVLFVLGLVNDFGVLHSLLEGGVVAVPAAAATWVFTARKPASLLVAFGLATASAVTVHLSGGYIEAHFHFFVMIVALTLYEDWLAFGIASGYVLVHHGVWGTLWPDTVYNHAGAVAHPWRWAAVHAGFVMAAALFAVAAWRLSEDARQESKRFAEELERSNRDLEQFAYVASHDLSEPLRTVSSYVSLLERRYGDQLDDNARQFIGHAVDGSVRMRTLIDDLLLFSRAGRGEPKRERVELDAVVAEVRDALAQQLTDAEARLGIGPLPAVTGDPGQLSLVLQNLISNAAKFAAPDRSPVITVDAERRGDWVQVSVQDNGIGVPEDQRQQIFAMFTRLHGRGDYGGTGVGLAICQRVVEHQGGRIWVEAAPGGGSRFCFTVPASDRPSPSARPSGHAAAGARR